MNLKQTNINKLAIEIAQACEKLFEQDCEEQPETALNDLLEYTDKRIHKFYNFVFEARNFTNYFCELKQEQAEWAIEMSDRQFIFQGGAI